MDAGAALRASAISALRFAIMYLATGAIFTYGVAALWACIPSAADATMVRASINLTILRCMGILPPPPRLLDHRPTVPRHPGDDGRGCARGLVLPAPDQ